MIPSKEKEMYSWDLEEWTAEYDPIIKNATALGFIRIGSESLENHSDTYS